MTDHPDSTMKACPFCGNSAPVMRYEWQVCCGQHGTSDTTCACEGPYALTEAEAIAAWNTRTDPRLANSEEMVERVARAMADAAFVECSSEIGRVSWQLFDGDWQLLARAALAAITEGQAQ